MASNFTHGHECEQCGEHYLCSAELERNYDGWPDPVCITRKEADRMWRLCMDCAEVEPSSYEADRYNALRGEDERRPHIKANSDLGKSIARNVRTER